MSNYLAVATVTRALGAIIDGENFKRTTGIDQLAVNFGRPADGENDSPAVNIYLYQVTPDAARLNECAPTRNAQGKLISRPRIPLRLFYLISFHGNFKELIPETLMGAVVSYLNAYPVLPADNGLSDRVCFSLLPMTTEEMSKLWSVFFQTPHALSVAYEASVVVLETDVDAAPAPPVVSRGPEDQGVNANADTASIYPLLTHLHIGPATDLNLKPLPRSFPAADVSHTLVLQGENLSGDSVKLRFQRQPNDKMFEVDLDLSGVGVITQQQIVFTLGSYKDWQVGHYSVKVVTTTKDRREYTSNSLPFTLAPQVSTSVSSETLILTCHPVPNERQRVRLVLLDQVLSPQEGSDPQSLTFDVSDLSATDAVVRLQVDGIESLPFERESGNPQGLRFADNQKVTLS